MAELNDLLDQLNNSVKDVVNMEDSPLIDETQQSSAYDVNPNAPATSADVMNVLKVEAGKIVLYEKATPFYNSKIFGVPLKYIALGAIIFKFLKDN